MKCKIFAIGENLTKLGDYEQSESKVNQWLATLKGKVRIANMVIGHHERENLVTLIIFYEEVLKLPAAGAAEPKVLTSLS